MCRDAVHLLHGGQTKFTTLKVTRLCPLVVVKINWWQGRGVGSGEAKVMVSGLFGLCSGGRKLSIWAEF